MTLNCSQSKIKLKNIMSLDSFMGLDIPDVSRIKEDIAKAKTLLAGIDGIHNVMTSSDFENFIFTVKFNFDSTVSLNRALNAIAKVEGSRNPLPYYEIYDKSQQQFTRHKVPDDSASIQAAKTGKLGLISGATATSIYRFPHIVKSNSNPKAQISKNKMAVMLKQSVTDIIKQPALFSNTILFK